MSDLQFAKLPIEERRRILVALRAATDPCNIDAGPRVNRQRYAERVEFLSRCGVQPCAFTRN